MVWRNMTAWFYCLGFILILAPSVVFSSEEPVAFTVKPDTIRIGTFYHGAEVKISADIESCDGAAIVLEGNGEEVILNKKGRVAILWMNVARVTISGLPQVYILATSGELNNICSGPTQKKLRLGLESLQPQMKIRSDQPLNGDEFAEFLELKIHNGTYSINNKIDLKPGPSGRTELSSMLPIPSQMPPGKYDIHLYCFRQGEMIEHEIAPLVIIRTGLPDLMISLAKKHAAAYGLMAILVAMAVGLLMGVIFSSVPGKGH